ANLSRSSIGGQMSMRLHAHAIGGKSTLRLKVGWVRTAGRDGEDRFSCLRWIYVLAGALTLDVQRLLGCYTAAHRRGASRPASGACKIPPSQGISAAVMKPEA